MRFRHAVETLALRSLAGGLGALPWRAARACGAGLGSAVGALGVRGRVARANLALAFPDRDPAWRERVLADHYRELGRVAAEYAHLPRLARAPREDVFASFAGERYVHEARALGRGVVFVTGHIGNFELGAAGMNRVMPLAIMAKPLSNPGVEAWVGRIRAGYGVELLAYRLGVRGAIRRLRSGGALALLADQDARRDGVFVPFFGRLASTAAGPAWLSLATGAPIVFCTCVRARDGRFEMRVQQPIIPEGDASDPEAVRSLTARHAALLEAAVRERPESWFWLHRRWKTPPPSPLSPPVSPPPRVAAPPPPAPPPPARSSSSLEQEA